MGELLVYLQGRKSRLQTQIAQVEHFDVTEAQQKIIRIDLMIAKLQNNPGWDV